MTQDAPTRLPIGTGSCQTLDQAELTRQKEEAERLFLAKIMGEEAVTQGIALYPALAKAYVAYRKTLISWWEAVVERNRELLLDRHRLLLDGQRLQYERSFNTPNPHVAPVSNLLLSQYFDIEALQELNGYDFETILAVLFLKKGFIVQLTPPRGDQGADLILIDAAGDRIAVQAKNTRYPVGNEAVQEVLGGMSFYKCVRGIVVTTSEFTTFAVELAGTHAAIALWDAKELSRLWNECCA